MATALTLIFGNEIKVVEQPRLIDRQYSGFPGVDGLTAMHMGSRGYPLVIRGTLRAATRLLLAAAIAAIEAGLWLGAADYSFAGVTYSYVVFEKLEISTDSTGKGFHLTSEGWVTCQFVMRARALI